MIMIGHQCTYFTYTSLRMRMRGETRNYKSNLRNSISKSIQYNGIETARTSGTTRSGKLNLVDLSVLLRTFFHSVLQRRRSSKIFTKVNGSIERTFSDYFFKFSTHIIDVQTRLSERAIELLNLSDDESCLVLDIGWVQSISYEKRISQEKISSCGSGLSGEVLSGLGHQWIGLDISSAMLGQLNFLSRNNRWSSFSVKMWLKNVKLKEISSLEILATECRFVLDLLMERSGMRLGMLVFYSWSRQRMFKRLFHLTILAHEYSVLWIE